MNLTEKELLIVLCCGAASIVALEKVNVKRQKQSRLWCREWVRKRSQVGCCVKLMKELRAETPALYKNFVRMNGDYDHLLQSIAPIISKQTTKLREPISASERLAVTLRYLATGESFRSLQYIFRIPHNTISTIVAEVCDAIYKVLQPKYLKVPSTVDEWKAVSKDFLDKWNFPNCIGSLDGTHSIVLMAISDASYKFLYIDVGYNGRISDGGVFRKSSFNEALKHNRLNLPSPASLPSRAMAVPYVLVADDAFALTANILKPYSARNMNGIQRVFNYRLSRARRVVENSFGIMSARFRVLRSAVKLEPAKVRSVTLACCVLHNYLIERKSSVYCNSSLVDNYTEDGTLIQGDCRTEVSSENLPNLLPYRSYAPESTSAIREEFTQYFVEEGEVPFQYKHI